ncbi:hypothetical protein OGAPHI_003443 [Ogataea philodendri]|uniref:Uncharacterized protein n=1 Tax=Ogataea philodendri TaxID=1378263 RepID=A0A9P8P7V5_9ASCO|nr:uncharacterized protein OGAPHI_003443 [Ogataea philodendri]KAH3666447.1 hypothetical protein OGAPHI_003443 [Ogataea philodendri]
MLASSEIVGVLQYPSGLDGLEVCSDSDWVIGLAVFWHLGHHVKAACSDVVELSNDDPGRRRLQFLAIVVQNSFGQELTGGLVRHLGERRRGRVDTLSVESQVGSFSGHVVGNQVQMSRRDRNGVSTENVVDFVHNRVSGSFHSVSTQNSSNVVRPDSVHVDERVVLPHGRKVHSFRHQNTFALFWLWMKTSSNATNFAHHNRLTNSLDDVHHQQFLCLGAQLQLEVAPCSVFVVSLDELGLDHLFQLLLRDIVLFLVVLTVEELHVDLVRSRGLGSGGSSGLDHRNLADHLGEVDFGDGFAESVGGSVVNIVQNRQCHLRRLDGGRCSHNNFSQTRNTKSNVSSTVTSKVECVQSHLSRWLTNRLRGNNTNSFSRIDQRSHVFQLHQSLELLLGQTTILQEELELVHVRLLGNIDRVSTIKELDQSSISVSDRVVVRNVNSFQLLSQTTLQVTRVGSLHGSVNQTFSTCHTVEVVLLWTDSRVESVLDVSTSTDVGLEWLEARKRLTGNHHRDSSAFQSLLSKKTHNLRNINVRTLGTRKSHGLHSVRWELLHGSIRNTLGNNLRGDGIDLGLSHSIQNTKLVIHTRDVLRLDVEQNGGDDLLTGPHWLRLEDGWRNSDDSGSCRVAIFWSDTTVDQLLIFLSGEERILAGQPNTSRNVILN